MKLIKLICLITLFVFNCSSIAKEELRILTWDGYITKSDVKKLDKIFESNDLFMKVKVINPYASGPDQMFDIIRSKKCDVSFLTLFFIKMNKEKITTLLEPINVKSKRLTNYKKLLPSVKNQKMGMLNGKPLYIPYGGGVYGFYVDMNKVSKKDVPKSINELWLPKWKNKISLNSTQIWYNIGISLLALGMPPFHLNDLLKSGERASVLKIMKDDSIVQKKLNALYNQSGNFWTTGTEFHKDLRIVSSWGPEIKERNDKFNGNWQIINFKEGNVVWLDTINFIKGISGNKLIAAELMANYFIGKEAQQRIVTDLSMISASSLTRNNPRITKNPDLFRSDRFVPPYSRSANNVMKIIHDRAVKNMKE